MTKKTNTALDAAVQKQLSTALSDSAKNSGVPTPAEKAVPKSLSDAVDAAIQGIRAQTRQESVAPAEKKKGRGRPQKQHAASGEAAASAQQSVKQQQMPNAKQQQKRPDGKQQQKQQRNNQQPAATVSGEQRRQGGRQGAKQNTPQQSGKQQSAKQQRGRRMQAPQIVSDALAAQSHAVTLRRPRGRKTDTPLRIIALGGLGEIGKNLYVYECQNDMLIVDCGLGFPDDDLLGVDLVIPDFTYLVRNAEKIRGIFVTHGHEDHIGALPYLLKEINVPVYGTPLTLGLIAGKLREHNLLSRVTLNTVKPGDVIKAGCMSVEFIHVTHSIPDSCALAINTPAGVVVHTGDFKVDYTPIFSEPIDLVRLGELGSRGVLALLCDSTNAERPGSTPSESMVGVSFEKLFASAGKRRIIIATFSSNVHRVQQIVDAAVKTNRKVAVLGRSMVNVVAVASELGYLSIPENVLIDVDELKNYTDDQIVLITTGSQGEPMSALTRMSMGDHRKVHIGANDYIIISASPIPGNEKLVGKVVNELMKQGAEVIYEKMYEVHVSGHACQDELKLMISLTRPRFFVPVHGEYKHLMKNAGIATSLGYDKSSIIISDIGKVVETNGVSMAINGMVPAGRVLVDGLGVGDVGSVVLRDRHILAEEGLIVAVLTVDASTGETLAGPDLISRGFVYVRENEEIMSGAQQVVVKALEDCRTGNFHDWNAVKGRIRDDLSEYIFTRTKRKPMILPVIQEI